MTENITVHARKEKKDQTQMGTSLAGQWLRYCTPSAGAWGQSLVRELRSYTLKAQPKKKKKKGKKYIYIYTHTHIYTHTYIYLFIYVAA